MLADIIGTVITSHKFFSALQSESVVDMKSAIKNHKHQQICMFTAPEAPVNLRVTERTAHAIHLMWQHPNITNGRVRQFKVSVKLISSHLRRPEQEMNMPERVLEVGQPSRNYSYEVSESWNLHILL
jgi:hypothetical protein